MSPIRILWFSSFIVFLFIVIIPSNAFPGTTENTAKDVWVGTVTASMDAGYYTETVTGTVQYMYNFSNQYEDHYKLAGGTIVWTAEGQDESCIYSGGPNTITITENNIDGEMIVMPDGRYTINNWLLDSPGMVTAACDGSSSEFNALLSSILAVPFQDPYYFISDSGRTMTGTYTLGVITFNWNLTSEPPQLEIDLTDYNNWMPRAGLDEKTPGNDLQIKARLLNADGSTSDHPADKFRFELVSASKEPGIAMNYPWQEAVTNDFDLQFLSDRNPDATKSDEQGQWLEMPVGLESSVTLTSFDWGAFGTLKVTASVDGIPITGYLKGDKQTKDILIPKRAKDSRIADIWKTKNNANGLADDSDNDNTPTGDGHPGDGLSLYEEYRGFMENEKHITTKPNYKDLFIYDEIGGRSKQGIALFAATTKLKVHHELTSNEFPVGSVINFNHGDGPHLVDQHGIRITTGTDSIFNLAIGGPGLPRQIRYIAMSPVTLSSPDKIITLRSGGRTFRMQSDANIYTHELGHCVNIWHHGDIDDFTTWSIKHDNSGAIARDSTGYAVILEGGSQEIRVYLENGQRIVPFWLQYADSAGIHPRIWVGYRQGQHSGVQNCIMRYDNANAYATTSEIRYLVLNPALGSAGTIRNIFCSSQTGTGINAPNRKPRTRFGNASSSASAGPANRGQCLKRICVNDSRPNH